MDRETLKQILNLIIEADLNLSLNINMTAADVESDADVPSALQSRCGLHCDGS
ncbi:MAG: hypothetical protein U0X92_12515 [Anaerolineales bacterium]